MTEHCSIPGINYKSVSSRIAKLDPYNEPIYKCKDDLSLSRLFAAVMKDQLRFNATAGMWDYYDGRRWTRDIGSMIVEKLMKTFTRALVVYAAKKDDSEYTTFISHYGNRAGRKRLIEDSRDFIFGTQQDYDKDPYLFNCQNCVLNLKTGEKLDHDPKLLLSKIANVTYDPEATSEEFNRFIHEIMMDDETKIGYIQRALGYSMVGENTLETCFLCYGSTTRNGKSTLLETIQYLFGEYSASTQPETLALRERNSRNASGDIARLAGCRLLHVGEPAKKLKLDVALVKNLTGHDPITCRNLYEKEFQYTPCFTIFINSNYLPIVSDPTLFSSERIKVIPFDRHFEPEERDMRLKTKLKTEENMSGVLNWCLDGLKLFIEDGEVLHDPEAVIAATKEYEDKSDKMASFIADVLIPEDGVNTSIKEAYHAFEAWCQMNGYGVDNKGNFCEELRTKGLFSKTGTIDGRTVKNVIKNYVIDCEYLGEPPPEW